MKSGTINDVAIENRKNDILPSSVVVFMNPKLIPHQTKEILLITKIKIDLEHCYGIKKLKEEIDFTDKRVIAIYAPNGSMKSSLAKAFLDLSRDEQSKDRYFPLRNSKRVIKDQTDKDLTKEMVFAIQPYDKEFQHSEGTSILLVDNEKRKELETIMKIVNTAEDAFLKDLKNLSKSKKDLKKEISSAFTKSDNDFYGALFRIENEIKDDQFSDILYDQVFDGNILTALGGSDIQSAIKGYIEKYNELLSSSVYFKKGVFNYYNAAQIAKQLDDNGFFDAKHFVTLNAGETRIVKNRPELEKVIEEDKQRILADKELRKRFNDIQDIMTKNAGIRKFAEYISNTEKLLPHLGNIGKLKEDVWKSYIKTNIESYKKLLQSYKEVTQRKTEIESAARNQHTLWENAIDTFNDRFDVPFKLAAKNKMEVMLEQEKLLTLDFTFIDGNDSANVSKEQLLDGLSTGESKAFYILNIIFEVERKRKLGQETVFIIDDIADSFDYKNKYAIIEYLEEISKDNNFYQIILTHNFDFFRTIESRYVGYSHCYMAYKSKDKVVLEKAKGIENPFVRDWKIRFFTDAKIRIACIPFMRNIIEYTKGDGDKDYIKLTSLLHWKTDTDSITDGNLAEIYNRLFGGTNMPQSQTVKVIDIINAEMKKCLTAPEGVNFENKIVLSIAIRLIVEKFMIAKINDTNTTSAIPSKQMRKLSDMYRNKFPNETNNMEIINRVNLMTPENIHLNAFMYEPILDMSDDHLKKLCSDVCQLK
jgi:ABC-type dipeptide/oligopeptide/nickel transport system ATPase component